MNLTISDRIQLYSKNFPEYPPLVMTDRWFYGIWMIGNNYHSKQDFYGEYPPSYLKRIMCLFPDCGNILHLFSGSLNSDVKGIKFDINKDLCPDIIGEANELSKYFPKNNFDIIYADPPYSSEDAEHYGTPLINRNKVLLESNKILSSGGFLVWLDQVLPMYRKDEFTLIGTIGLIRSTNHRFRVCCIFQKI